MTAGLEPYFVAAELDGAEKLPAGRVDPFRVGSSPLLDLIERLDGLVNGADDRPLPRWAFYDCAEVPGAVAGFAVPAPAVAEPLRQRLGVEAGYGGLVPLSAVAAIPMLVPGAWHLYALASAERIEPGCAPAGLAADTLATALASLGAATAYAAVPWGSWKLAPLARFAPLELLTAWTPAHSDPATVTVRFEAAPGAAGAAAQARCSIAAGDGPAMRELQWAIEAGRRYEIVGPPDDSGVPIREVPP